MRRIRQSWAGVQPQTKGWTVGRALGCRSSGCTGGRFGGTMNGVVLLEVPLWLGKGQSCAVCVGTLYNAHFPPSLLCFTAFTLYVPSKFCANANQAPN